MNPWRSLAGLPRDVWVLFTVTLVNRAGTMVLPFFALYVAEADGLGFGTETAGALLAGYGVVALVMAPIAGKLADRFGPVRIMRFSLVATGCVLLVLPFARSLPALVVTALAWAAVAELLRPASLAVAADAAPPELRRQAFAVNRIAVNLGMSVGPVAGGFLAEVSYTFLFVVDAATSLGAAVLLFVLPLRLAHATPHVADAGSVRTAAWYRDRRLVWALAASLPIGIVFFQLLAALPLHLKRTLAMSESEVGMLFAINTVLIVLTEVPLNAATSRWTHRRSLALGAALTAIGFGATAIAFGPWTAAATVVVWTVGEMILFPALAAHVSELAPPGRRGHYMGLYSMTFGVAFAIGPLIGTQLLAHGGGTLLWPVMLAIGALSTGMFLRVRG